MVQQERLYSRWNADALPPSPGEVNLQSGIMAGKLAFNRLHKELAEKGFTQVGMGYKVYGLSLHSFGRM